MAAIRLPDIGIDSRNTGNFLADVLAGSSRSLTRILEYLSGEQLHLRVLDGGQRALTDSERFRLAAAGIIWCRWRRGLLVTGGGLVAASTVLVWLPARLPHGTCAELDAGAEPAGVILERLGMRRTDRRAMATRGTEDVTGTGAAVRSTAVLEVDGQPAGYADEYVTRQFADSLAG